MSHQKTSIDWFAFRSKDTPDVFVNTLQPAFPEHHALSITPRKTGWRSFERAFDLWVTDTRMGNPDACARIGMMMTGGESVRGWSMASITGAGCSWVDWGKAMDCCTEDLSGFELKRVDVALDRFDGSHWHEVDAAWKAGEFSPAGGGKAPKAKPIDSRRPEDGRTYYVGNREGAKFYRGYEKGMQLLGPQMAAAEAREQEDFDPIEHLCRQDVRLDRQEDGRCRPVVFELRDWWRDEVEFKPVNQPLPLDIIENRDQYFAGAYPYLSKVLPTVDVQALIQRREKMPQLELSKALAHIQRQFGRTLYTALHAYHGDLGEVWSKIVGREHNRALVEAGVLLVEHE